MNKHNADNLLNGDEGTVVYRSSQGMEMRGTLRKMTRFEVVFEILGPQSDLRMSEVLDDTRVLIRDNTVYSGRAVIRNLINMGTAAVCEATLDESGLETKVSRMVAQPQELQAGFQEFSREWGKNYKVRADFKVLLADMHTFLADLQLWLGQASLGTRATNAQEQNQNERRAAQTLESLTTPAFCALFEKFEIAARQVEPESQAAHAAYCRRMLHPHLLSSPFMNRIFTKPLGYAGDYEMVSMILRDPYEGDSLFAKLLNCFILSQSPAIAHRNRVDYLVQKLVEETFRVSREGRPARIYNIGCGPAGETQRFLRDHDLSNHAHFTLLDSNDETLQSTGRVLEEIKRARGRHTQVRTVKKSVHSLLKQTMQARASGEQYDFIYCAGLFDYLNDRVCQGLLNVFYEQLAPGGLLVATNVDVFNPIRSIMEFIFDWHLIYRNGRQLAGVAPQAAAADELTVHAEPSSSNIFLEVRKPR